MHWTYVYNRDLLKIVKYVTIQRTGHVFLESQSTCHHILHQLGRYTGGIRQIDDISTPSLAHLSSKHTKHMSSSLGSNTGLLLCIPKPHEVHDLSGPMITCLALCSSKACHIYRCNDFCKARCTYVRRLWAICILIKQGDIIWYVSPCQPLKYCIKESLQVSQAESFVNRK